jgi:DNA-binding ferritin-like protein
MSYHKTIDDFWSEIENYKDEIAENIQAVIGQFTGKEFLKLELPVSENPLDVINELKICVNNFMELHADNIEYEGCRNATSGFLQIIHKYIYLFRLCKINEE